MYSDEDNEIVGAFCELETPFRGYTNGVVVCDYGFELLVRVMSGASVVLNRDEVYII
ncbi:MAG: ribonuclease P [Prevotellaceae bacterium]|nr:ribonuclease P [Prevotellaceae bacterium]